MGGGRGGGREKYKIIYVDDYFLSKQSNLLLKNIIRNEYDARKLYPIFFFYIYISFFIGLRSKVSHYECKIKRDCVCINQLYCDDNNYNNNNNNNDNDNNNNDKDTCVDGKYR